MRARRQSSHSTGSASPPTAITDASPFRLFSQTRVQESMHVAAKLAQDACWPGARPDLSVSRRRGACLGRVPSVAAAACKGTARHPVPVDLHRPSKAFLSLLSGHFPLSPFRVPVSTSVRTAHPRLRRAADGGAIMGPQVSQTGDLCVGLPSFPPFLDFCFPFPREMPFCFSDPTKINSP